MISHAMAQSLWFYPYTLAHSTSAHQPRIHDSWGFKPLLLYIIPPLAKQHVCVANTSSFHIINVVMYCSLHCAPCPNLIFLFKIGTLPEEYYGHSFRYRMFFIPS